MNTETFLSLNFFLFTVSLHWVNQQGDLQAMQYPETSTMVIFDILTSDTYGFLTTFYLRGDSFAARKLLAS